VNKQIFYSIFFIFFINTNCFEIKEVEGAIRFTYNTFRPLTLKIEFKEEWVDIGNGQKKPKGRIGNWKDCVELKTVIVPYATINLSCLENKNPQIPILLMGTHDTFGLLIYCAIDKPKTTAKPFKAIKKEEYIKLINAYKQQNDLMFTIDNDNEPNVYSIAHSIEKDCSGKKLDDFIQEIPNTAINNLNHLGTIKFPELCNEKYPQDITVQYSKQNPLYLIDHYGTLPYHSPLETKEKVTISYVDQLTLELKDSNYSLFTILPILLLVDDNGHALLFNYETWKNLEPFAAIYPDLFKTLSTLLTSGETPVFSINNQDYYIKRTIQQNWFTTKFFNKTYCRKYFEFPLLKTKLGKKYLKFTFFALLISIISLYCLR